MSPSSVRRRGLARPRSASKPIDNEPVAPLADRRGLHAHSTDPGPGRPCGRSAASDVGQRPGQLGVRFSAKAATPSRRSPEKAVARQQASSTSRPGRQVDVGAEPHRPLGVAQPDGRVARRSCRGELEGAVAGRAGRHHLVDRAQLERRRGREPGGREDQPGRPRPADAAHEQLGAAAARDDARRSTSGSPTSAPSPATTRSHDSASSKPPPSAKPSTAAIAGTGARAPRRMPPGPRGRCSMSSASVKALRSLRSAPTQKAWSWLEVSTTHRTVSSAASLLGGARRWPAPSSVETAFIASGRSSTISATCSRPGSVEAVDAHEGGAGRHTGSPWSAPTRRGGRSGGAAARARGAAQHATG